MSIASPLTDALDPAGPQAAAIGWLWWLMLWTCVAVFVAVMAFVVGAVWRARLPSAAQGDRGLRTAVVVGVALSTLGLSGLLAASVLTDRTLARLPLEGALSIHVVAHQWWWEVTYDDARPDHVFTTANELVVPVGRPVVATLQADDVIHSFWIPGLHGKKDLIPGRTATIEFRVDRAGRWTGRCAEYCGVEHAFMAMDVRALAPDGYEAWTAHQREPAPEPAASDAKASRGRELFLTGSCMLCHAIGGTTAAGRHGPDLTHVAAREHLGAGRLGNSAESMAHWIEDAQASKPGVDMPPHHLPPEDIAALVAYLETLR